MNRDKLVTVAMPVYNGENFIRQQLESIYNQTYKNIEVVVCDDCSTDGTVEILEEYAQKYGLKYQVNSKNLGLIINYENVARMASGEFIAFADHDDLWVPEKIETLVANIGENSLITSDACLIDQDNNVIFDSFKKFGNIYIPEKENIFKFFVFFNFVSGHATMIKSDMVDKMFPVEKGFVDADWWMGIVASRHGGVKHLEKPLVKYRQHGDNSVGAAKQRNIILSLFSYFSEDKKRVRRKSYEVSKNQAQNILNNESLNLTEEEKNFLKSSVKYFDFYLGKGIDLDTILFAYENRNIIFKKKDSFRKLFFLAFFIPYRIINFFKK